MFLGQLLCKKTLISRLDSSEICFCIFWMYSSNRFRIGTWHLTVQFNFTWSLFNCNVILEDDTKSLIIDDGCLALMTMIIMILTWWQFLSIRQSASGPGEQFSPSPSYPRKHSHLLHHHYICIYICICGTIQPVTIHHICPFFSTDTIFGSIFLHTKARKSRQKNLDKTA